MIAFQSVPAYDDDAGMNVSDVAAEAVFVNNANCANDAEPNKLPISDPENEPVLICIDDETIPTGIPINVAYDAVTMMLELPSKEVPLIKRGFNNADANIA